MKGDFDGKKKLYIAERNVNFSLSTYTLSIYAEKMLRFSPPLIMKHLKDNCISYFISSFMLNLSLWVDCAVQFKLAYGIIDLVNMGKHSKKCLDLLYGKQL